MTDTLIKSVEFIEFPKMPRLSRECVITEKLDGTNAQVFISDTGEFLTGSRSRWITPENDNYGFSRWAHEHKTELLKLGPGRHFGEWWGNRIQRGYGLSEKRFSLFNVIRWCLHGHVPQMIARNPEHPQKLQDELPDCVSLVPVLWRGQFDSTQADLALAKLAMMGSVAAPGFMRPEGVVLYHIAGAVGFKKTLEKDEVPKSLA